MTYERGLKTRIEVIGKANSDLVTESLKDLAPIVDDWTQRAFEDVIDRPVLDIKMREMITITNLVSQGDTAPQLKIHIQGALNTGWTVEEILEAFIHLIPYSGFPRVLNGIRIAKELFEEKKSL
ncbi:carboxymuconolactone decarboxylase family protein [Lactococcus termiticola]|uniref:4-carboxymuconolactone decarboxylase n=1 Tax=Lactococcus termiticola TaxID=2169526 RepID=A0A2R5HF85_9LACT|nr:carboxymuconolactone decarboxylase family protein [Lactococcus termiticola]GBG96717.1 4-carboxymuconolactone decarboxylase [Lactococcus termiticola]